MTVAELIQKLQTLPKDLPVHVNDECGGKYHEDLDAVFQVEDDPENGDTAAVVIAVNAY